MLSVHDSHLRTETTFAASGTAMGLCEASASGRGIGLPAWQDRGFAPKADDSRPPSLRFL